MRLGIGKMGKWIRSTFINLIAEGESAFEVQSRTNFTSKPFDFELATK
jgi:hypothetical protein